MSDEKDLKVWPCACHGSYDVHVKKCKANHLSRASSQLAGSMLHEAKMMLQA